MDDPDFTADITGKTFVPLGDAGADLLDDTRSWVDPNGYRLSDRLWRSRSLDRAAIDTILRGSIATGDSPLNAAKRLEAYLSPSGRATQTDAPPNAGRGNYAARRLARTETTRAFGKGTIDAGVANPFVDGEKWNLSGSHKDKDACDDNAQRHSRGMNPGEYTFAELPSYPNHPHELCFLTHVVPDADDVDAIVAKLRETYGIPRPGMGDVDVNEYASDLLSAPRGEHAIGQKPSAADYLVQDAAGRWSFTPERQALHDDIVRRYVDHIPVSEEPTVHMLGGGPAAGKSSMLRAGELTVPEGDVQAVLMNPDLLKAELPGYAERAAAKDLAAGPVYHEESSYLAKRLLQSGIERKQDVLIDGVGANYRKVLDSARPQSYSVKGYYAYVPDPEVAVERAAARALKEGRDVPAKHIRDAHRNISEIWPDAAEQMDQMVLYDTSEREIRRVAQASKGKIEILDEESYGAFRRISGN